MIGEFGTQPVEVSFTVVGGGVQLVFESSLCGGNEGSGGLLSLTAGLLKPGHALSNAGQPGSLHRLCGGRTVSTAEVMVRESLVVERVVEFGV